MDVETKYGFIVSATIFELVDDPELIKKVSNKKLITAAFNRLKNTGFLTTCDRCCGTGHYSFNYRDGTICLKCNGLKYAIPRMTKSWKKSVLEYNWREYMENKKSG